MQLALIRIFRCVPVRGLYPLMWLWVLGYILVAKAGRSGIYAYWRHRGASRMRSLVGVWQNYCAFGKVILDRFAAYAGRRVEVRTEGLEILQQLDAQPGGYMVLSSHVGNQEMAGYTMQAQKPMHVLIFMGDTATVNDHRAAAFAQMGLHLLPLEADGSHVLKMHEVLSNGEVLSIHGDRLFADSRLLMTPILGAEAPFPEGPYRVAVAEGVPVLTMFMMREKAGHYTLYVRQLSDGHYQATDRRAKAQELLRAYVAATEEILSRYPSQWFHFYRFWP